MALNDATKRVAHFAPQGAILSVFLLTFALTGPLSHWPEFAVLVLVLFLFYPALPPLVPLLIVVVFALLGMISPAPVPAGLFVLGSLLFVLLTASFTRISKGDLADLVILAGVVHALFVVLGKDAAGRGYGLLDNANIAGSFLAMVLLIALARSKWPHAAAIAIGLLDTASVGALLGAVAGLAVWAGQDARLLPFVRQHRRWVLILGGCLSAALALFLVAAQRSWWPDRLLIWQVALQQFTQHPITGGGLNFYRQLWQDSLPLVTLSGNLQFFLGPLPQWPPAPHAHNVWLNVAAEAGVIGLAALAILVYWLFKALKGSLALPALTVLVVHNLVDVTVWHPAIVSTVAAIVALGLPEQYMPIRRLPGLVSCSISHTFTASRLRRELSRRQHAEAWAAPRWPLT